MRCHTEKEQVYNRMNSLSILPFVFGDVDSISGINGLMVLLVMSKFCVEKGSNVSGASCKVHNVLH